MLKVAKKYKTKNFKMKWLAKFILETLWGWRIVSDYPHEIRKSIILAVPHTSNWDFPIGILLRNAYGFPAGFVAKASLFKGPLGGIMRWLNGVPVERGKGGFTQQVVDEFKKRDELVLCIAPEGTRKRVEKLRTGFYYIALGANVPVLLIRWDWHNKQLVWSPPMYMTGNLEKDMADIENFFRGTVGFHDKNSFY